MTNVRALSRRQFLKTTGRTALGVAAGAALPNLFLNRTRAASGQNPSEFVRVGFIGMGGQGMSNLRALMKNAVAVCDVDQNHLQAARQAVEKATGRTCAVYRDYRRMLEDASLDAVCISTPDHWHALPTIHACEAGKDVYVEKPLTLTIEEGRVMVSVARHTGRVVQTGSQQRSDTRFRQAVELVRNGRLGVIKRVLVGLTGVNWTNEPAVPDSEPPPELDYDFWLGPAPWRPYNKHRVHYYFRFFWDYSGGQMTNWGAHHLDIAQWGLGMDGSGPVEIRGTGEFDPQKRFEVPAAFSITYRYANGVLVECRSPRALITELLPDRAQEARQLLNGRDEFTGCIFEGERGLLYVNRGVISAWPEEILEQAIGDSDLRAYASRNHHQNWLDCIRTRALPICDVAVGHRSATVCHLGNIAVRTGRVVRWDPVQERILGDADLARWVSKPYRPPWSLPKL
ncbi:MAG: Gfo/Idh/MocA family oxidoreductase [Verrucomicrobiota bacterium]|nr:Gfo/Idh/MocA family oxidoreductase [Limisphaera sp.]MDW8381488.1 Gfo/Idh/MocA family oxidoreductase [Verrucomicrobiota bacterium]